MAARCFLLVGLCLLFVNIAHASGLGDLQAFYQKVHSLSAHFQQTRRDDSGQVVQQAGGIFLLSRPKRFRWQYNKPYKQIIVSNGKTFKFYDVDLQQVTIRPIGASLRATPALLLTGGIALKRAFHISSGGTHDGLTWVTLTPKARDTDFKRVALGLKNQIPMVMMLHDKLGQITQITFSDIKINPQLADSRFTLDIPKGVTVVHGRRAR
jgi:outer membrane lipoprotein carrier protein